MFFCNVTVDGLLDASTSIIIPPILCSWHVRSCPYQCLASHSILHCQHTVYQCYTTLCCHIKINLYQLHSTIEKHIHTVTYPYNNMAQQFLIFMLCYSYIYVYINIYYIMLYVIHYKIVYNIHTKINMKCTYIYIYIYDYF